MIRTIITIVLPLVLPTLLYFLWASWAKKKIEAHREQAREDGATPEELEEYEISTPWLRLVLAGVGLLVVGLIISVLLTPNTDENGVYQPPREENGQIVPGRFVPMDEAPQGNVMQRNTDKPPADAQPADAQPADTQPDEGN